MKTRICAVSVLVSVVAAIAHAAPVVDQQHLPDGSFGALAVANDNASPSLYGRDHGRAVAHRPEVEAQEPSRRGSSALGLEYECQPAASRRVGHGIGAGAVCSSSPRPIGVLVSIDLAAADVFVTEGSLFLITLDSAADNRADSTRGGLGSSEEPIWGAGVHGNFGDVPFARSRGLHSRSLVDRATEVTIDIRPHNNRNRSNLGSRGNLAVAVLHGRRFRCDYVSSPPASGLGLGAIAPAPSPKLTSPMSTATGVQTLLLRFELEDADTAMWAGYRLAERTDACGRAYLRRRHDFTIGCPP